LAMRYSLALQYPFIVIHTLAHFLADVKMFFSYIATKISEFRYVGHSTYFQGVRGVSDRALYPYSELNMLAVPPPWHASCYRPQGCTLARFLRSTLGMTLAIPHEINVPSVPMQVAYHSIAFHVT